MRLLKQLFTWWNSQTLGTRIYTWRKGKYVGTDDIGNRYYQCNHDSRRWVIYEGECEASRVSAEWHGWLHHTIDYPPLDKPVARKFWEKPHNSNRTGSELAYHPLGTDKTKNIVIKDYEPWSPE